MPTKLLTDKTVANIKAPTTGRLETWDSIIGDDATLPGTFCLRVTERGVRSWSVMFRVFNHAKGKNVQKRMKLGEHPAMSLKEARTAARDALTVVARGEDPSIDSEGGMNGFVSVADAVADFIEKHAKRKTRGEYETRRVFDRYVLPHIGEYRIDAVTHAQVRDIVEGLAEKTPYMANRTLAAVRKFFNWAAERQLVTASPVAGINKPGKETARDRVLVDDEITALWETFDGMGWPFGLAFKLLLVTGQRLNEVAKMRWKDLDADKALWTLPREATKADRAHEVPLSPLALEVLQIVPHTGDYVFTTNGKTPISGFSRAKGRADKLSEVTGWRLHDLRRTAASQMARIGIAPHVVEKILNHSTGQISGVAAVYNRHAYTEEKRAALNIWSLQLESLLRPGEDNIVKADFKGGRK
jgi:integrase